MVISVQAVSWPSHYNNISAGKVITNLSQVLSDIKKKYFGFKGTAVA
jgi:hypothetical protein